MRCSTSRRRSTETYASGAHAACVSSSSCLGRHRRLHAALSARRQVFAALQRLGAVLTDEGGVVRAEVGAVLHDRAATLATVKQGGTARMLGHDRIVAAEGDQ
jgi:hypothetical protein